MDSFGKNLIRFSSILALTCVAAASILAMVNKVTKVKIEENRRLEIAKKQKKVMPDASSFKEVTVSGRKYSVGYTAKGKELGVAFQVSTQGYGGMIDMTIGIKKNGLLSGIAIGKLDQQETPGLGIKITKDSFQKQFADKREIEIRLSKEGGKIDAVTAATISSKAVISGVLTGFRNFEVDKEQLFQ